MKRLDLTGLNLDLPNPIVDSRVICVSTPPHREIKSIAESTLLHLLKDVWNDGGIYSLDEDLKERIRAVMIQYDVNTEE